MYRIYISDISRYSETVPRYWDYIKPEKKPEDTRSGDEIAADIINRLKREGG